MEQSLFIKFKSDFGLRLLNLIVFILFLITPIENLIAQKDIKDTSISMSIINVGYTFDLPAGN